MTKHTAGDSHVPEPGMLSTPMSRGTLLRGAAVAGAGLAGTGTGLGRVAAAPRAEAASGTIQVWHPYTGAILPNFLKIFPLFQKSNPAIVAQPVYAANDLASNQKLFAAVAAGRPPDVTWVDGPEVAGWAFRGI